MGEEGWGAYLNNNGGARGDGEANRSVARRRRDWQTRRGDSGRDGHPCRDGRGAVRAGQRAVKDTRRRSREEDEQADIKEDRDDGADELRDELVPRLGAEEVTGLQVARHVRRLRGRARGDDTGSQIDHLRVGQRQALALADTAEDELGCLCDG